jgi:putative mRNA 3-end processing factor
MSVIRSDWVNKICPYVSGAASGWMALRRMQRSRSTDYGFVLSDHADWPGLNAAVEATGRQRVIVTHGYQSAFARTSTSRATKPTKPTVFFQTGLLNNTPAGEEREWED